MTAARDLVKSLAALETGPTEILAPLVPGSSVRSRTQGLLRTWRTDDPAREGWVVVRSVNDTTVTVVDDARPAQIERYLEQLKPVRLILVKPWSAGTPGRTWLALPWNASDVKQRFGVELTAVAVHLVDEGHAFDVVVSRFDGGVFWFHAIDRTRDPRDSERLRDALAAKRQPDDVAFVGLTPEQHAAYSLALVPIEEVLAKKHAETERERVERHVEMGGGRPLSVDDRGDHWLVTFRDRGNTQRSIAVQKGSLTVTSAGICLSGRDRDFDLASIVGVVSDND